MKHLENFDNFKLNEELTAEEARNKVKNHDPSKYNRSSNSQYKMVMKLIENKVESGKSIIKIQYDYSDLINGIFLNLKDDVIRNNVVKLLEEDGYKVIDDKMLLISW